MIGRSIAAQLREIIRQRQRAEVEQSLTLALLKGLDGDNVELTDKELASIRKEARNKIKSGRRKK